MHCCFTAQNIWCSCSKYRNFATSHRAGRVFIVYCISFIVSLSWRLMHNKLLWCGAITGHNFSSFFFVHCSCFWRISGASQAVILGSGASLKDLIWNVRETVLRITSVPVRKNAERMFLHEYVGYRKMIDLISLLLGGVFWDVHLSFRMNESQQLCIWE